MVIWIKIMIISCFMKIWQIKQSKEIFPSTLPPSRAKIAKWKSLANWLNSQTGT
jgi:hypothetical protein